MRPLADEVIGNVGEILWILLAAVGVVLLIPCGNVANLFPVRAEGRFQEFAVRSKLGASRNCITRALLAAVALLATYLPARRASHVDPAVTLRADA